MSEFDLSNVDSKEELYFIWYLEDLKKKRYIISFDKNGKFFQLSPKLYHTYKDSKNRDKNKFVVREHIYTYDFNIKWSTRALGIFVTELSDKKKITTVFTCYNMLSHVEIKADYDRNNMTRLVQINIKWTYEKFGVLVNLIKIPKLFRDTFVPQRYLLTDKSGKKRKIKFEYKQLSEFVKSKK